jgi:DNA gyrase/topoisomerase IV subunit B
MPDTTEKHGPYTAESIEVLEGLEPVRRRPGLYIGALDDPSGVLHLLLGALRSAVVRSDHRAPLHVALHLGADGSYEVRDDAPPASDDPRRGRAGRSPLALELTTLHGRSWHLARPWDQSGADLAMLNALSAWLRVETRAGDRRCTWEFDHGNPAGAPRVDAAPPCRAATRLAFRLDPAVFAPCTTPDFATLAGHVRAVAAGHPWLSLTLHDERTGRALTVAYPDGAVDLLRETAALSGVTLSSVLRVERVLPRVAPGAVRADVALACFVRAAGNPARCELLRVDSAWPRPRVAAVNRAARRAFCAGLGPARRAGRAVASAIILQGYDGYSAVTPDALGDAVRSAAESWAGP